MIRKILLSFLASLVLFWGTATPALAQTQQWYDSGLLRWYTKVYDTNVAQPQEIYGERYTAAQVQWVVYSLIVLPMNMMFSSEFTACVLTALDGGDSIFPCLAITVVGEAFRRVRDFVVNLVTYSGEPQTLAEMVFTDRPLSGITYFKNMARRASLIPEAQAQQGFGYGALEILQPLWERSRDLAYGLLIFVAIIMAFMIMFRTKVSPQAVITVQSAIPKLVAAIILVTFSYAIAGLMIDLMYVVIGMVASILSPAQDPDTVAKIYRMLIAGPNNMGILGLFAVYLGLFPNFFMVSIYGSSSPAMQFILSQFNIMQTLVSLINGIVVIVFIFAFFKILAMLIRNLVSIYLLVIFAPFYILGGTVTPSLSFGNWLKDLISNLAVYPAVGIMFLFSLSFLEASAGAVISAFPADTQGYIQETFENLMGSTLGVNSTIQITNNGWAPPFLNIGGSSGSLMMLFVSLSIILLIPKIADMIKGFMSGRPYAYGTGIGEAFGPIAGAAAAGYGFARTQVGAIAGGGVKAAWSAYGPRMPWNRQPTETQSSTPAQTASTVQRQRNPMRGRVVQRPGGSRSTPPPVEK